MHLFVLDGRAGLLHRLLSKVSICRCWRVLRWCCHGTSWRPTVRANSKTHPALQCCGKIESKLDIPLRRYVGIKFGAVRPFTHIGELIRRQVAVSLQLLLPSCFGLRRNGSLRPKNAIKYAVNRPAQCASALSVNNAHVGCPFPTGFR